MCIYKFCQTKEYLFMIFFCFIQKPEGYFYDSSWFFMFYSRSWMFYYMYLKKYSCFITFKKIYSRFFKIFQDFSCFIQDLERHSCFIIDFHEIFKIFQDFSELFMFDVWFVMFDFMFDNFNAFQYGKLFFTILDYDCVFYVLLWVINS